MRLSISTYANNELRFVVSSDSSTRFSRSLDHNPFPLPCSSPKGAEGRDMPLLDIIKKSQSVESSTPKSKVVKTGHQWGKSQTPKNFTKNAKHLILESGAALERVIDKNNSRFLTLTLPTSVSSNYRYLADWSGYLVNLLLQQIRNYRRDHKVSYEIYSLFCWEYQKRGALHLHFLIAADFQVQELAEITWDSWFRGLRYIEEKSDCDLFGQWRDRPDIWASASKIEIPRKSIARYLSKYVSKNSKTLAKFHDITAYPSRFWGSSRNLKSLAASWRAKASFKNLDNTRVDYLRGLFDSFLSQASMNYKYEFLKSTHFVDGFVFYFSDDAWLGGIHEEIFKLIESLNQEALGIVAYSDRLMPSLFDLLRSPVPKNYSRINPCGDYSEQYKIRHGIPCPSLNTA